MSTPNWSLLVEQGRARAFGVPWNEEEIHALYTLKIPVEFVREGCLTIEDYEKKTKKVAKEEKKTGVKPMIAMKKSELMELAIELGIPVSKETPRTDLMQLIKLTREQPKKTPVVEDKPETEMERRKRLGLNGTPVVPGSDAATQETSGDKEK